MTRVIHLLISSNVTSGSVIIGTLYCGGTEHRATDRRLELCAGGGNEAAERPGRYQRRRWCCIRPQICGDWSGGNKVERGL
ncbi:hypothetical protein F5Y12DRAFT_726799 [Xylaria sp. FL1777]|nr:hypothetical protein F5Y12DRAFT_726799 [Xylaria sp. FL1777]